jgi:tetratricopeptide (TPR) repeat protein
MTSRFRVLLLAMVLVAIAGRAHAQSDYDQCGKTDLARDTRIHHCTRAIQSGGLSNPSALAFAFATRGLIFRLQGEQVKAIADYSEAIRLAPLYDYYWGRGVAYELKRDRDTAIADFNEALRLKPDYYDAHLSRGIAYYHKRDYAAAHRDYDRALKLSPEGYNLYWMRGDAAHFKGDVAAAKADYDEAVRRLPNDANAFSARGFFSEVRGDFAAALRDYEAARRIDPKRISAARGIGRVLFHQGQYARAREEMIQAQSLEPANGFNPLWLYFAAARAGAEPKAVMTASWAAVNPERWPGPIGEWLLGRRSYDEVIAFARRDDPTLRNDRLIEAYFFRGLERLLAGDRAEARRLFETVIDLGPPSFYEVAGARAELARLGR